MSGTVAQVVATSCADLEKSIQAVFEAETNRLKASVYDVQKQVDAISASLAERRGILERLSTDANDDTEQHRRAVANAMATGEAEVAALQERIQGATTELEHSNAERQRLQTMRCDVARKASETVARAGTVEMLQREIAALLAEAKVRGTVEKALPEAVRSFKQLQPYEAGADVIHAQIASERQTVSATEERLKEERNGIQALISLEAEAVRKTYASLTRETKKMREEGSARMEQIRQLRVKVETAERESANSASMLAAAEAENEQMQEEIENLRITLQQKQDWESVLKGEDLTSTSGDVRKLCERVKSLVDAHPKNVERVQKRGRQI